MTDQNPKMDFPNLDFTHSDLGLGWTTGLGTRACQQTNCQAQGPLSCPGERMITPG